MDDDLLQECLIAEGIHEDASAATDDALTVAEWEAAHDTAGRAAMWRCDLHDKVQEDIYNGI